MKFLQTFQLKCSFLLLGAGMATPGCVMVRECGWKGLGGAEGLEPLGAPEQSLQGLSLLSRHRLAVTVPLWDVSG